MVVIKIVLDSLEIFIDYDWAYFVCGICDRSGEVTGQVSNIIRHHPIEFEIET